MDHRIEVVLVVRKGAKETIDLVVVIFPRNTSIILAANLATFAGAT